MIKCDICNVREAYIWISDYVNMTTLNTKEYPKYIRYCQECYKKKLDKKK